MPLRIVAAHHGHGRADRAEVPPGSGGLDLRLRPGERVAVQLLDAQGAPVTGAALILSREDGVPAALLRTDSEGRIATLALPSGTYSVSLRDLDGRRLEEPRPCGTVRSGPRETVLRLGS